MPDAVDCPHSQFQQCEHRQSLQQAAFWQQVELDEAGAYDYARAVMTRNALANDAQEGMCAFLEKRPAAWTGK